VPFSFFGGHWEFPFPHVCCVNEDDPSWQGKVEFPIRNSVGSL
jgi:hypothetical protein